jgi:asparagine synthase (glutamine-hydrolysing)
MLLPGHTLLATQDGTIETCYWDPVQETQQELGHSREFWKKKVYQTLANAVEQQLVADVPFGAFLSGGIDSSALVGLMSEVATEQVKTFCVTFAEKQFSEAPYARIIAKKFKTDHHEIKLDPQDFLNDLPAALAAMDHPSGDGPNTYFISKATKSAGITMAFSGLGGDELFAGYDIFKRSAQLSQFTWLNAFPQVLRKSIGKGLYNLRPSVASAKVADILELDEIGATQAYPINRQVLMNSQILKLLQVGKLPDNKVSAAIALFTDQEKFAQLPLLSRISLCEISTYMQNVLLRDTDQMSMANALEVRVPFLDHKLVELVLQIPDGYKYPHTPKQLLVESLGDLLPDEVVNRPKMGFTLPFDQWMKGELQSFCQQRLIALSERAYFDRQAVLNLWKEFSSGKATVSWSRIWILVVLENWLAANRVV